MPLRHGHARRGGISRTYAAWRGMIQRCENAKNPDFAQYGGRGIQVSLVWHQFDQFLADMGDAPAGRTLERRDNGWGYCKANCYWATRAEQAANTRRNRLITKDGLTLHVAGWARRLGISPKTLLARLNRLGEENFWTL